MDLRQLRCFVAVADELHFGRAAQRLGLLPSALGRHVRLLEEALGTQLLTRTTRHVALTPAGSELAAEAHALLGTADSIVARFRAGGRAVAQSLKIGAIDTAAAGLMPMLLRDLKQRHPAVNVQLLEDKTVRILPRLLSGRLDLALVRPPAQVDRRLELMFLFHETAVVAVPTRHRLAGRKRITISDLAAVPLILPDRRSRPHSHDLTIKLFAAAGLSPVIAQVAEEKQTIVNLVAAKLGVAIVPRWTSRIAVPGVRYVRLAAPDKETMRILPLAAAWLRGSRDPVREEALAVLGSRVAQYARTA